MNVTILPESDIGPTLATTANPDSLAVGQFG
jgi:hypothetical protein